MSTRTLCCEHKYEKISEFSSETFLVMKFSVYLTSRGFVFMEPKLLKMYIWTCAATKIQINLCVHVVWSEFSLGAFWIAKDTKLLHADNEDSN